MKKKLKCLDLFCCEGGASWGLMQAGFEVTGIDIEDRHIYYPFRFLMGNALTCDLSGYDFYWASPPCQSFVPASGKRTKFDNPNLIPQIRERLRKTGKPYVIENVATCKELHIPFLLCGQMFDLNVIRHRLFETNFLVNGLRHEKHDGRKIAHVYNHFKMDFESWSPAMKIEHTMSKFGLKECIPPAYSRYIGEEYFRNLSK